MNMSDPQVFNTALGIGGTVVLIAFFYSPLVRRAQLWTITITPLASIIGSGFLITAPLLYANFSRLAVPAIIVINSLAMGVGLAIRHNIKYFDTDRQAMVQRVRALDGLERFANIALAISYVISVAFYTILLSAFTLEALHLYSTLGVRLLSTTVLTVVASVGYFKGLHGLEGLEKVAVNLKMAIIAGLVIVLVFFHLRGGAEGVSLVLPVLSLHSFQILGGMLLITQGFETAKYLGHAYDVMPRVRALLLAQVIATSVYIVFVWLVGPLAVGVDATRETAIIAIISKLAAGLGLTLSLGAVCSQFSAAIADTVGTGGIVVAETRGRFPERRAYVVIIVLAIALLWTFDVFAVLALASRAFAAYYGLQCIIASLTAWQQAPSTKRTWKLVAFPILAILLVLITLFAIPAEQVATD